MTIKLLLSHHLPDMSIELTHDSSDPMCVQYKVRSCEIEVYGKREFFADETMFDTATETLKAAAEKIRAVSQQQKKEWMKCGVRLQ